jgi:hypothetical protein
MHPSFASRVLLGATLLLAGCGSSAVTGATGPRIPVAAVAGTWTVSFPDAECLAGPLTFSVAGTDEDVEPFGSLSFTSTWSADTLSGPLVGTINVVTSVVTLHLYSADGFTGAASIDGSLDQNQILAGTLTDPYAAAAPVFNAAACQDHLVGHHE